MASEVTQLSRKGGVDLRLSRAGTTLAVHRWAPLPVTSTRTLLRALDGTVQPDGAGIISGGLTGFDLVQTGGGTLQYDAASAMGGLLGIEGTPLAGAVLNTYQDFTNTNPVVTFGYAWGIDEPNTQITTTFDRFYPDSTHGAVNLSLQRTAARNLRVLETNTATATPLDQTSTGTIPTGTNLWVEVKLDATLGQVTARIYQLGTPNVVAEVITAAGAWKVPFTVQSRRWGCGNANGFLTFRTNNWNAVCLGSLVPRMDITRDFRKPAAWNSGHFPSSLTRYPATTGYANLVITTPGVYTNLDVYGRILVQSAGVTLRNLIARGPLQYVGSSGIGIIDCTNQAAVGTVIEDVTVVAAKPDPLTVGIDGNFKAKRLNLYNLQDCTRPRGVSGSIVDSWFHDFTYFLVDATRATSLQVHSDDAQLAGAVNWVIRRNLFDARYGPAGQFQPAVNDDTSLLGANNTHTETSCLMINISLGVSTTDLVVEDNWLFGGYTPVNSGNNGTAANLGRFWRNWFDSADKHGTPEITLRFSSFQVPDTGAGTANANRWWDGAKSGQEVTVRYDG